MNALYLTSAAGFVILTIVFYGLLYRQLSNALQLSGWTMPEQQKIRNRSIFGFFIWFFFLTAISLAGISSNFNLVPFNVGPVFIIPLVTILLVTYSKKMKHLLPLIPETSLVYLQVFRLFVEILLWMLFTQGLLPVQMTFEGRNFDVLTGITAPLVAFFLIRNKQAMIVWHLICLGLLVNIVVVAVLSMPTPFRVFDNEPANTIVTAFPFILLPGFLVPLAYWLHLLSLRQLAIKKRE